MQSASDSSRLEITTLYLVRTTPSRDLLLVRIRRMVNRDLLEKAEIEINVPLVRMNSHVMKKKRIRSSLLVKMRTSSNPLDSVLNLRVLLKVSLPRVRSLKGLLRVSLRVRSPRVLLRVSLLRASLRVRSLRVLLRVSHLKDSLKVRSLKALLRVSLLRDNLRVRSLRVLLNQSNLLKRSPNGSTQNLTVKNGSPKKKVRASSGSSPNSLSHLGELKKMMSLTTPESQGEMMILSIPDSPSLLGEPKKMMSPSTLESLGEIKKMMNLSAPDSPRELKEMVRSPAMNSLLVMNAPLLRSLPVRSALPEKVMRTSLSLG